MADRNRDSNSTIHPNSSSAISDFLQGEGTNTKKKMEEEKLQAMSERNKSNKAKQVINHICGRKSFQAISYHARDPDTGKEPNFQDLWQMTHMKNSGEWVDGASIEKFI
ncbi:hypothetical protein P8452_37313 [Trifolium repens]|nr:hypothetical protein P8452_37313 [Trifolium repens]